MLDVRMSHPSRVRGLKRTIRPPQMERKGCRTPHGCVNTG
jgi:hypothetical protein